MSLQRLLIRNLLFHWRGNLAILLGVAVASAVLTGALLVGDSLRGSLRELTNQRLGWIDQALVSGKFVQEGLARKLPAERVSPAIFLQGTIRKAPDDLQASKTIRRVGILGVDARFWLAGKGALTGEERGALPLQADFWTSKQAMVVLSRELADVLGVKAGESVTLQVPKTSGVPRESLLGKRAASDVLAARDFTVALVLPADHFGSQFSLSPTAAAPRNAFVPLPVLQDMLGEPGRVNALFAREGDLEGGLARALTLQDWGLVVRDRGAYLSLESRQMLLEPAVAQAALPAAREAGLTPAPTLVYLVNNLASGQHQIGALGAALSPTPVPVLAPWFLERGMLQVPYSVVAALDPALAPPLGPFLPAGVKQLKDNEIALADWADSPLHLEPGDLVTLTYFRPVEQGRLTEATAAFRFSGLVPMKGVAADSHLTPEFPGITDKLTIAQWDPPFPYDNKRLGKADEAYWKKYRATPKGYVTLKAGQQLWQSRFGKLTSIRLMGGKTLAELAQRGELFKERLLANLKPGQGGLVFNPVRKNALEASQGGTDFSGLFLGFSFFLIAAALLLVGLLFRLNLERRAAEVGLLRAAGYSLRTIRWLLLGEGAILAALGSLLGIAGALLYAACLLKALTAAWPASLDPSFLGLHLTPTSLIVGYFAALVVSLLTILWAVRLLGQSAPAALLAGSGIEHRLSAAGGRQPAIGYRASTWVMCLAALGAIVLIALAGSVRDHEMQAMTFLGGGALCLTAGLSAVWILLKRTGSRSGAAPSVAGLGMRNAGRNPVRSLLTVGLLAAAAFLIVAVDSFRRQPDQDFLDLHAGSGGFALVAESDVPIYQDLNSGAGRAELDHAVNRALRAQGGGGPQFQDKLRASQAVLNQARFFAFRVRPGDDASCLNLYKPGQPRLLGVPPALVERGGFRFAETLAQTPEEKANPWLLLNGHDPDGTVPVFGEENTVTYILHSKLGGIVENVRDGQGKPIKLRIVGLFKDSVFQSGLLMAEARFLELYPDQEGFHFFLIEVPAGQAGEVRTLLDLALADEGFETVTSREKLATYLAVENIYLSMFQALGGLGLLLGALGLAVVLLRNVWERRSELALLRALGFRRQVLGWLVLAENGFLLLVGLGIGTVAALLAVAPHLWGSGGSLPWLHLLLLLPLVIAVGLAAGAAAVRATLNAPLVPALRKE